MQLKADTRLGPYEIVASLGAGGRGEVYRARDPRLQRDVAIKILPAALATDPVAHARFERGARDCGALASQHPRHSWHGFPRALRDGRVIFLARRRDEAGVDVLVANARGEIGSRLDLPTRIGRVLVDPHGAVIYGQNGQLIAQRVDWSTLTLDPGTTLVANDVIIQNVVDVSASLSETGVLAYRQPSPASAQFEWVDRSGRVIGTVSPIGTFTNFDPSAGRSRRAVACSRGGAPTAESCFISTGPVS